MDIRKAICRGCHEQIVVGPQAQALIRKRVPGYCSRTRKYEDVRLVRRRPRVQS